MPGSKGSQQKQEAKQVVQQDDDILADLPGSILFTLLDAKSGY